MRPLLRFTITIGLSLSLFPGVLMAKHTTTQLGAPANGIMMSRHNLAKHTTFPFTTRADLGKGTTETCVFCHTPHFAASGDGPIWNRQRTGDPIGSYGGTIAGNNVTSGNMFSTLACLSCHDGVTTFDNLINRPGKGLGTGDQGWAFSMAASTGLWSTQNDHFDNPVLCNTCHDPAGVLYSFVDYDVGINRLIIGEQTGGTTDLTNDHPIGVYYRGEDEAIGVRSASLRARSTVIGDIDMDVEQESGPKLPAIIPRISGSNNLWAVKGFISNQATIGELLRSGGGGPGEAANYVQCSSCHDPHYKNRTNPEKDFYSTYSVIGSHGIAVTSHENYAIDGLFLRRVGGNSDSGVCRTCHNK